MTEAQSQHMSGEASPATTTIPSILPSSYISQFSPSTQSILNRVGCSQPHTLSAHLAHTSASAPGIPFLSPSFKANHKPSTLSPAARALQKKREVAYHQRHGSSTPMRAHSSPLSHSQSQAHSHSTPPLATKTRFGRQVLKPLVYNPTTEAALSSRNFTAGSPLRSSQQYLSSSHSTSSPSSGNVHNRSVGGGGGGGRHHNRHYQQQRTVEQALCAKCTRMQSPASNQIVFCDGCDGAWHQRCHVPVVEDEVVKDEGANWYCGVCLPRRMIKVKRKRVDGDGIGRGGARPRERKVVVRNGRWTTDAEIRYRYFANMAQTDLIDLLVEATGQIPKLNIFPVAEKKPESHRPAPKKAVMVKVESSAVKSSSSLSSPPPPSSAPTPNTNFTPVEAQADTNATSSNSPPLNSEAPHDQATEDKENAEDQEDKEDSPLPPAWPAAGKGMYALLPPEVDDDGYLVDDDDRAAFSVIVYDDKGVKMEENGVRLSDAERRVWVTAYGGGGGGGGGGRRAVEAGA